MQFCVSSEGLKIFFLMFLPLCCICVTLLVFLPMANLVPDQVMGLDVTKLNLVDRTYRIEIQFRVS